MSGFSPADRAFMAEAIALGVTNLGQTGTNPSVGCILVKDGKVVGRGVTAPGGRPHGEPQALAEAGDAARGATAYVSLEPCSHYGHTPPCALALITAGISRVVAATLDPNVLVAGKGMAMLADAGLRAEHGLLSGEARRVHAGHIKRVTVGLPEVFLKLAVSADGFIGRRGAGQLRISGEDARAYGHRLRAQSNAIAVGIGTVLADDPELTCRLPGLTGRSPDRIVFDRHVRLPERSKLAQTAHTVPTVVIAAAGYETGRAKRLESLGVRVVDIDGDGDFLLNACRTLCKMGYNRLMVEGGAHIAAAMHAAGSLDAVHLICTKTLIGADGVPALGPLPLETLASDPYVVTGRGQLGEDTLQLSWKKDWV